ncbi:MAG: hypothetical protein AAF363_02755 [Bacteroidota bacterium]
MKIRRTLIIIPQIVLLITISSCSDDDSPTLAQQQLDELVGTWAVTDDADITTDGTNATGDWSNFQIIFALDQTVQVSGVPQEAEIFNINSFEVNGSSTNNFSISFNDKSQETASISINGDILNLSFVLSSDDDQLGQRISSTSGEWMFRMNRQ